MYHIDPPKLETFMITMEGEFKNLTLVCLTVMASLSYCHFISSKLPKGKVRLISIAPVLYIFTVLPLYLTSAYLTAVFAYLITWLASFKLLLFAFDQGPLSSVPHKSLPLFIAIAALLIKIKPENSNGQRMNNPALNLAVRIPFSFILIHILSEYSKFMHPYTVLLVHCCLQFLFIDILGGVSSLVARVLFGMDTEQASDAPYLSTSVREFWGKRWNLIVSGVLHKAIYKPVRSALGGDLAALPAVLAVFLVSGLMHELWFWYVTRARPSWETTAFFVVQGVFVVVEFVAEMAMAKTKWRLPSLVRRVLTLGFVVGTSFWLFFPPLMRNGTDVRVLEEFLFAEELVKEKVLEVLKWN